MVLVELVREMSFTLRRLRRRPRVAVAILATWGLAFALLAFLGTLLHAAWVQPVTFPESERLLDVLVHREQRPENSFGISTAHWVALQRAETLESVGAYLPFGHFHLGGDDEPERIPRHLVTSGFFRALGVEPRLGRVFTEAEERAGADGVVVLSDAFWRRRFGADETIVGRDLFLDGEPHRVLGVMPATFGARGGQPAVWAPLVLGPDRPVDRRSHYLGAIGRIRPGISVGAVRDELAAIAAGVEERFPTDDSRMGYTARPLTDVMTAHFREQRRLLFAAVLFVVALATVNVAHLLLSRELGRRGEIQVRRALGASRLRLAAGTLLDAGLLALAGAAIGVVGASFALDWMPDVRGVLLHSWVSLEVPAGVLGPIAALAMLLAAASALPALGLGATFAGFAPDLGHRASSRHGRLRAALVAVQAGLAVLLVAGSTMTLRSLAHLRSAELGMDPGGVVSARLSPPKHRFPDGRSVIGFYRDLLDQLAGPLGGEAVGLASGLPGTGWGFGAEVEGRADVEGIAVRFLMVSRDVPRLLGFRRLAGRDFGPDDGPGSPPVVMVNRAVARALADAGPLVGQRLLLGEPAVAHEVVAIVEDARLDPTADFRPTVFALFDQAVAAPTIDDHDERDFRLLLRTERDPAVWLPTVRRAAGAEVPLSDVAPLRDELHRAVLEPRAGAWLLTLFAGLALGLAAIGILGAFELDVIRRRSEIGIRMALGARPETLQGRIVRRALLQAGLGAGAGLVVAVAVHRALASLLYGVSALDPGSHAVAAAVLLGVAAAAAWVPARRISRIDPARALRDP